MLVRNDTIETNRIRSCPSRELWIVVAKTESHEAGVRIRYFSPPRSTSRARSTTGRLSGVDHWPDLGVH